MASTVYEFTLVNELPEIVAPPDTTGPTVVVEAPDEINSAGKLPFTITFSEMLASTGFGAFTLMDDVTITGGTAMDTDLDASAAPVYTLTVTPNNPRIDMVTVTVGEVIQDAAGNPLDTAGSTLSASYMRPDTGNTPPYFVSGASVPDIKIWQGYAYSTDILPTARDNEIDPNNRIEYRVEPALPAGFELVFDSASNWFIEVKEANKGMTVAMQQPTISLSLMMARMILSL